MKNLLIVPGCATALVSGYSAMDHTPVFPVPVEQVYAKLHATRFSDELGSVSMRKSAVTEYVDGEPDKSLTWSLNMEGYSLGQIEAQLTPNGAGSTKVAVNFKAAQSGPLKKLGHYEKVKGQQVRLKTFAPLFEPPRKNFLGTLSDVSSDAVTVVVEGAGAFTIKLKDIARANLEFTS